MIKGVDFIRDPNQLRDLMKIFVPVCLLAKCNQMPENRSMKDKLAGPFFPADRLLEQHWGNHSMTLQLDTELN